MKLLNFININILAIFLTACGGGGSSSTESSPTQEVVQTVSFPIEAKGISSDYSMYAWNINNTTLDPAYASNYNIDSNAHINMPTSTNNQKIKVAIIDQGFEYRHPDIYDKITEVKYVQTTTLTDEFHGTPVVGVIASTYLGVAPNNVELILINIDFSTAGEAQIISAFNEAKKSGAKIINCSWGTTYNELTEQPFSTLYTNTIQSLKDDGITVVFSSGNQGYNLDDNWNDESELTSVIGVGASSVLNDVTYYSNYGSNIDIIAPGGGGKDGEQSLLGILSLDLYDTDGDNITLNLVDNYYTFTAGTSFATPTITGVIALMLSQNPNLTPDEIRTILIETADKVGGEVYTDLAGDGTTSTFNIKRAYGKVNASAAVQAAINAI